MSNKQSKCVLAKYNDNKVARLTMKITTTTKNNQQLTPTFRLPSFYGLLKRPVQILQ